MNTEKGANHCQQNCDPLDEDNDFTRAVSKVNGPIFLISLPIDRSCVGSRAYPSKGSSRRGIGHAAFAKGQQGTIGHEQHTSRMPRLGPF
jgi:hypothetical protein